jgi:hypothetical protein
MLKKAEKEATAAAKKGADTIKAQIKRVKDEAAKATKAELKAVTTAIKKAGKDSTKELGTAIDESLKSGNESARVAIQDLGEKMLEEDQEMFEKAKAHETELAKEVIKLVWEEGLQHSYDSVGKLKDEATEKAKETADEQTLALWHQSEHDAGHAKNVSLDSLHTILTMWQSALTKDHKEWSKVSNAFDSANTAAKLSHDTVAHVLSSMELSRLLRDTAVFYKLDAKEAYDRSAALLSKAQEDYALTKRNADLISGLEDMTEETAGSATRAMDAAKKVAQEIEEKTKK